MTYKLLLVDDEMPNLRLLDRLFSSEYQCLTASSGSEAIRLLEQHDVAIMITDQRMPEMTGIDLLKRTAQLRPHMVRILLTGYTEVEALVEAINCGLVYMYFTKPWNNEDLKLKVSRAREHYENNRKRNSLVSTNDRLTRMLKETRVAVVEGLADMLRIRDQREYDHSVRVQGYAQAIAEIMELDPEEKETLSAAALLHSLSQNNISGVNMRRSDERASMTNNHSECEARLMTTIADLAYVRDIIKFQRENFDGTGFPGGLKGDQIPIASRILRVAADYDSMIQPKSSIAYMRHDEAMHFLLQRSGKQFDPNVIETLSLLNPETLDAVEISPMAPDISTAICGDIEPAFVDATVW
jgi:response regulator RpfG family c-di-GMP phosphodiesterase